MGIHVTQLKGLSHDKAWTSKEGFNQPSFEEKKSCPTRPTVTRSHKLHGSPRSHQPTQEWYKTHNIRGGNLLRERGMQRRPACAGKPMVMSKPASNCHLMQPVAWRCPDLGLNPKTCVDEPASMRHDRGKRVSMSRSLSTAATTKRGPPRMASTSRSLKHVFENNLKLQFYNPTHPPDDNKQACMHSVLLFNDGHKISK